MGFLIFWFLLPLLSILTIIYITAVVIFCFVKFVLYIFQSFGLLRIAKKENYRYPYLVWVPAVSQYYLGRYCMNKNLSIGYAFLAALSIGLPIAAWLLHAPIWTWTALGYGIAFFVVDMLVMNRFYKKVYKAPELYTILTVLTLGLLKPVFLYMARFRKITRVAV